MMNREEFEALGDLHKSYETPWTQVSVEVGKPIVVRLDGKAFHTFTRGLKRPHDERLRTAFIETTKHMVNEFNATVGYCQSDEITLVWTNQDPEKEMIYSGRVQKLCSLLAASASVKFNRMIQELIPEKADLQPIFDARVFQYPDLELAASTFVWREADATRNSLTMAAHAHYPHGELHKVGFEKKHQMLREKGISWEDYPASFKRGTYVRREKVWKELTPEELASIPPQHRPKGPVQRSVVMAIDMPPVTMVKNLLYCLFGGEAPQSDWKGDTAASSASNQLVLG